ncbi:phosphate/phosphite/phosphonate ABC transporter substrate-binding protein [Desulfosarcina cetonica]|uniref:phosphate/phosphite/phosphonate ABC transporter substrate-binding protein n=1 Tax=Desulfosarcina cetonica TaxID=90730 RepID=UPI0009F8F5E3|nr:phosphate/phosphite/phosphonate ABC transporter substrate-binding protein [Desulfosarcina cetonica]
MVTRKGWAVVLAFLSVFFISMAAHAMQEVRFGVLAKRGVPKAQKEWGPTARYLSEKLSINCVLVPLKFTEIEPALKNGQIHFLLANSAFYAELEKKYNLRAITTMINRKGDIALKEFGGVLFARNDSKIHGIADIRGKKMMCVKYSSFGGAQMVWHLLLDNGINPKRDCAAFVEGGTHDNVVMAVKAGKVDVGTVRSDTLERMEAEGKIKMSDFRIINPVADSYPFVHSTPLYPEWPVAACAITDPKLARDVAKALILLDYNHEP